MIFKGTFDFGDLNTLHINMEVEGFQPRFDNCIAITAYDRQQTLVLTLSGQLLLLKTSLSLCLKQFCEHYRIDDYEMAAYYRLVQCRTQGYIAGHYRLVPSQGASNPHVVYYNGHFLDCKHYSSERHRVLLTFDNQRGDYYQLYVDACYRSFVHILAAAEKVSEYQLKSMEEEMRRLGVVKKSLLQSSQQVFQQQIDAGQLSTWVQSQKIYGIIAAAFEHSYGQKPDPAFNRSVFNLLNCSQTLKNQKDVHKTFHSLIDRL